MSITKITDLAPEVTATLFVRQQAERTAKEVGFGWIGVAEAPNTYQQLRGAFQRSTLTGEPLPVSNLYCDSSIYLTPDDNIAFRFWHDVHHVTLGCSFRLEDELELALWHLDQAEQAGLVKGSAAHELLTSDLVGQLFLMALIGRFPFTQAAFVEGCQQLGLFGGLLSEIRRVG